MSWLRYWPVVAVVVGLYGWESAWGAILIYHAGIVVALVVRPEVWKLWGAGRGGAMAAAAGVGLLAGPLVGLGMPWVLGDEAGALVRGALARYGLEGWKLAGFAVYFVTLHPVLEELAWRGVLREERLWWGRTDLEFAAYHLVVLHRLFPGAWLLLGLAMAGLATLSVIWRELARRSGGLRVPASFHAGADAGLLGAALFWAW